MNHTDNGDRRRILNELRHQMRYAMTPSERDSIRKALDFWQRRH